MDRFLSKVTARNIVRFKSRLIMTIGGVAGCTALIVCGLAINDTVAELGVKQYRGVYQYDLMVVANMIDAGTAGIIIKQQARRIDELEKANAKLREQVG